MAAPSPQAQKLSALQKALANQRASQDAAKANAAAQKQQEVKK